MNYVREENNETNFEWTSHPHQIKSLHQKKLLLPSHSTTTTAQLLHFVVGILYRLDKISNGMNWYLTKIVTAIKYCAPRTTVESPINIVFV